MDRDRKVALIGLDSITPVMIEPFIAEGRMPNLKRIRDRGWWAEMTPTMPPTTPAGWTTVATGAWPSTHGIEGFAVHVEGEPLDRKRHGTNSERSRAEFVWQAAERAGRRTILLKYPLSWPPRGGPGVTQVDGAAGWGGMKCVFDLAHSGCWDTARQASLPPSEETVGSQEWMTRDQDNLDEESVRPLRVDPAGPWTNLPLGARPLWETRVDLPPGDPELGTTVYALAVEMDGREALLVSPTRDASAPAPVTRDDWSGWIPVSAGDGPHRRWGHVRFKVMELDGRTPRLRLYQSQIHQDSGYTRPPTEAAHLLASAGPFEEWSESYDRLQGWIDDGTQLEIYRHHLEWMSRAAAHLLGDHPWDLFMTQVQILDMAYHLYWGAVDPGHPNYDPARAPEYWAILGQAHELADRFLGEILSAVGPDALVMVLGEHGQDLYHTTFMANHLLLREGLLELYRNRRTGAPEIDWRRTRAFASSYRVYLNVAGRDPDGIVAPDEYTGLQDLVIEALHGVRDARSGRHPVGMAMRREDARALGLYGGSMGDVVFGMAPGYQTRSTIEIPRDAWAGPGLLRDAVPVFRETRLFRDFTGEHDTSMPYTRAVRTMLFLQGPGVRPGHRTVPVSIVDVAPTICSYLGVPFPAQCEGRPIWDAFGPFFSGTGGSDGRNSAELSRVRPPGPGWSSG
jgi:predicted AlkP superfamily phosphohydrolase/phosphomutase